MEDRRQGRPRRPGVRAPGAGGVGLPFQEVVPAPPGTPPVSPVAEVKVDALLGTLVDGRYRIERLMGAGGMSRVYLGTYEKTGVSLAIKMIDLHLSGDPAMQQRSLGEARAMMSLQSNHVVHALDVGSLPSGQLYIVMEFLDGEDLDALLVREGPLPWARVADIGAQICSGLATAHRRGIVHRDIKPQNCFRVTVDGNPEHIKIIDFGVARELNAEAGPTQQGFLVGTPEYMAPELLEKGAKADARSDIYGVGVTLYKLLTGVVPYRGPNALATLAMHVESPLIPPSKRAPEFEIPPEADEILGRALAKSPKARYAGADEMALALRAALGLQRSGMFTAPVVAGLEAPSAPPRMRSDERDRPDPQDESLRASTAPWQAARPRGRPEALSQASAVAAPMPGARPVPQAAVSWQVAAPMPPLSAARAESTPDAGSQLPPAPAPRPVIWQTQILRLVTVLSIILLFFIGTQLIAPEASETDPRMASAAGGRDRGETPIKPAETTKAAETPVSPPTPPTARQAAADETPKPAILAPPTEEVVPAPPTEEVVPAPPTEEVVPTPTPEPGAAKKTEPEAIQPDAAPRPVAVADFPYGKVKVLLDEQAAYVQSVCFKKAEKPVTRLKIRIDVRPGGNTKLGIISQFQPVRACVRNALSFNVETGPRVGAFEYVVTQTATSIKPVPLESEGVK